VRFGNEDGKLRWPCACPHYLEPKNWHCDSNAGGKSRWWTEFCLCREDKSKENRICGASKPVKLRMQNDYPVLEGIKVGDQVAINILKLRWGTHPT